MDDEVIATFLREMREGHGEEIDSVMLPDGTEEYVRRRMEAGDVDTLMFMLRLGYLMGLNTGYAAAQNGHDPTNGYTGPGPLKA